MNLVKVHTKSMGFQVILTRTVTVGTGGVSMSTTSGHEEENWVSLINQVTKCDKGSKLKTPGVRR